MTLDRPGQALILSAPSGAGKTTLVKRLTAEFDSFAYSISYTTRMPREGEVDGLDYHFVSVQEFKNLRDRGFFAEWAEVHGNFYGTPLQSVVQNLAQGHDMLFDIDVQGALSLKRWLTGAYVFILPPSRATLLERLNARGKDPEAVVRTRMENALGEIRLADEFDYLLVNDDLETAYDQLRAIYLSQQLVRLRQPGLTRRLIEDFEQANR